MIEKFLVMQTAANDVMVYPVSRLKGMEGKDGNVDITFDTVGANSKKVDSTIVVADDVTSTFIHPDITSIAINYAS